MVLHIHDSLRHSWSVIAADHADLNELVCPCFYFCFDLIANFCLTTNTFRWCVLGPFLWQSPRIKNFVSQNKMYSWTENLKRWVKGAADAKKIKIILFKIIILYLVLLFVQFSEWCIFEYCFSLFMSHTINILC